MADQILNEELYNIELLFCEIQPEMLIQKCHSSVGKIDHNKIDSSVYLACYDALSSNLTRDEIRDRYNYTNQIITDKTVFGILSNCGDKMLRLSGDEPLCRIEDIIRWSQVGQAVGQDNVVTAWLASMDAANGRNRAGTCDFTWPGIIRSDDFRLNRLLDKGLAENHFHLNGSTQNFTLTWTALMNYPGMISSLVHNKPFSNISLQKRVSVYDNEVMDIQTLLLYAAIIRALLFSRFVGRYSDDKEVIDEYKKLTAIPLPHRVNETVTSLRWNYGCNVKLSNGSSRCLDYAVSRKLYKVDFQSYARLLSGERAFLYSAFYKCFSKGQEFKLGNMLYLYLLIKIQFRRLFIQVNKIKGFDNFSEYQDRKDVFYENIAELSEEALKLAVAYPVKNCHVKSLEARIMPKTSANLIYKGINDKDHSIGIDDIKDSYFYVCHFPKYKMELPGKDRLKSTVRNAKARKQAELSARSLVYARRQYDNLTSRIRGIDACSHEIDCRPETFATEYRYLRNADGINAGPDKKAWITEPASECRFGFTYHVGEDYRDICDGLRAVDEALRFLGLQRGDRIGHGLAMGVNPEEYYAKKRSVVYLPAQNLLDNCVWLIYRSLELGVKLESDEREKILSFAEHYLSQIYGCDSYITLRNYYDSWKLRGDHPSLYITGQFKNTARKYVNYDHYMIDRNPELNQIRFNLAVSKLYFRYHYDEKAIKEGNKIVPIDVDKWYIRVMRDMQDAMMKIVASNGISIECNPTSNKLIGPFDKYSEHPILRFNSGNLGIKDSGSGLMVTINTDDLGVFDTSLENEYAVMLRAIVELSNDNKDIRMDDIYAYLDGVREMGLQVAFG